MSFQDDIIASLPNLRAFAISLCHNRDTAEDLVQTTFLKAWLHEGSFEPGTNIRAWLFTILRNEHFSQRRKWWREIEDADGQMAERVSIGASQEDHMRLRDVARAWSELPFEQQQCLELVAIEGLAYEDAALVLGAAVGTIKSRVNRARVRLAELTGEIVTSGSELDKAWLRLQELGDVADDDEVPSILSELEEMFADNEP